MSWCLVKSEQEKLRKAFLSGELNPVKLAGMDSLARRKLFEKFITGDNAKEINALFESKLLLKNQQAGMVSWAKRAVGISRETRMDIISKIERMDKVLNPKEGEKFLQDLAEKRLGLEITEKEAKTITDLSKKITELREKTDVTKPDITLGRAMLDLTEYVNSLSGKKADLLTNIAGVPRAAMASFDLSAPFNQGWGMASRKRFYTSLGNMFKYVVSKKAYRDLQAEIITSPEYPLAKKAGLRLTELGNKLELREEQFMTTLLDKIPGFSASQRAYTGFLNKVRIESFKDLIKKAEVAGEDVSIGSKTNEDLARAVNDFTGGARVGKVEGAVPLLNAVFFSPRKITSTVNMLNPINYVDPKISKTARQERTRNMIGSLSLSLGIIALYSLLSGKKQEADPTSTDFGKIRSGDTRLDVSGGNATYFNLLARLATQKIKSSTGVTRELGTGYGQTSGADLISQFLRYKLSPNASLLIDVLTGANAIGEKKTIPQSIIDRFKPMFASSLVELLKSDTDGKFAFAIAGLLGGGLNTFATPNIKSNVIPTGTPQKANDIIELVKIYAEAVKTDPETAFNRFFTGQKILKTTNGAIIVERMELAESQAYKEKYGANTKQVKLDHTVPLELGGSNDTSNLKLVSTSEWSSYTKVENALGRALKAKKITKDEAQAEIKKFKNITDTANRKAYGDKLILKYN